MTYLLGRFFTLKTTSRTQKADVSITIKFIREQLKPKIVWRKQHRKVSLSYPEVSIELLLSCCFFILEMTLSPQSTKLLFNFNSHTRILINSKEHPCKDLSQKSYPASALKSHWPELNLVKPHQVGGRSGNIVFIWDCNVRNENWETNSSLFYSKTVKGKFLHGNWTFHVKERLQ